MNDPGAEHHRLESLRSLGRAETGVTGGVNANFFRCAIFARILTTIHNRSNKT